MKLIYIAHPLAGDGSPEWGDRKKNVERYLCFCAWAMEQGHAVLSWVHHELLYDRGLHHPFDYWLERDIELLIRADEVWLCGPVAVSKGMQVEAGYARGANGVHRVVRHEPEWDDPNWWPEALTVDLVPVIFPGAGGAVHSWRPGRARAAAIEALLQDPLVDLPTPPIEGDD